MEIRFYADMFFILNLIMNLFLMSMTVAIRRKQARKGRIGAAAVAGALVSTGLAWLELGQKDQALGFWRICLLAAGFLEMNLMLWLGLPERFLKEHLRNAITFWKVTVLTAGMLFLCREQLGALLPQERGTKYGSWFVLAGAGGVTLAMYLQKRLLGLWEQEQNHIMDGTLIQEGREYSLRALYDTGNRLISPYTQEPVMVISRELLEQLGVTQKQNPEMTITGSWVYGLIRQFP